MCGCHGLDCEEYNQNIVNYTEEQQFNFFGTRGKISNPNRTFNAEFKYLSSFSPSPTVFVTAKLSVKEMCIFT